jgi:hypothetical protein
MGRRIQPITRKYEEALVYERNIPIQEAQRDRLGVATSLKALEIFIVLAVSTPQLLMHTSKPAILNNSKRAGTILGSIGLVRALQGNMNRRWSLTTKPDRV